MLAGRCNTEVVFCGREWGKEHSHGTVANHPVETTKGLGGDKIITGARKDQHFICVESDELSADLQFIFVLKSLGYYTQVRRKVRSQLRVVSQPKPLRQTELSRALSHVLRTIKHLKIELSSHRWFTKTRSDRCLLVLGCFHKGRPLNSINFSFYLVKLDSSMASYKSS